MEQTTLKALPAALEMASCLRRVALAVVMHHGQEVMRAHHT